MKKFIVFVAILLSLGCTGFVKIKENTFAFEDAYEVCFVAKENLSQNSRLFRSVECGNMTFNYCSYQTAANYAKKLDFCSVQFYFKNKTLGELEKKLKITMLCTERVSDINVYCGYSPYIEKSVFLQNKKVNVQIAEKGEMLIVGFPLILTGY